MSFKRPAFFGISIVSFLILFAGPLETPATQLFLCKKPSSNLFVQSWIET